MSSNLWLLYCEYIYIIVTFFIFTLFPFYYVCAVQNTFGMILSLCIPYYVPYYIPYCDVGVGAWCSQDFAKINQDRACVVYPYLGSKTCALLCVYDGHGERGDMVRSDKLTRTHESEL